MSSTRKTTKKTLPTAMDFEKSLAELNTLIEKMETGQLNLESSLQCFEEGIAFIKHCQEKLKTAEQKIKILTGNKEKSTLNAFSLDDEPL